MQKLLIFAMLLFAFPSFADSTRTVDENPNKNYRIHTALGYSTVVDFPTKPLSAILGDQDAFKLEFHANSITIKPVVTGAKSNLFVVTQSGRDQFTLISGPAAQVDYLVKLRSKQSEISFDSDGNLKTSSSRHKVARLATFQKFRVAIDDIEEIGNDSAIHFQLSNLGPLYEFSAASIGIKKAHQFLEIENAYLDDTKIGKDLPSVRGTLILKDVTLQDSKNLIFVFAVPNHRIALPISQRVNHKAVKN